MKATCHPYMFYEYHPHSACSDVAGFCCQTVVVVVVVAAAAAAAAAAAEKPHKDVD
jgi:hypothetical protein